MKFPVANGVHDSVKILKIGNEKFVITMTAVDAAGTYVYTWNPGVKGAIAQFMKGLATSATLEMSNDGIEWAYVANLTAPGVHQYTFPLTFDESTWFRISHNADGALRYCNVMMAACVEDYNATGGVKF